MVPVGVHDAEGRVAVVDLLDDDAHRPYVIELGELEMLLLHLAPDAVDVLGPAVDIGLYAVLGKRRLELGDELVDVGLTVNPLLVEQVRDLLVDVRMKIAEGEVLKLPLELSDAEAVRERRVDGADFLRDEDPGLLRGALHLAQDRDPLRELDADRADILNHGDEHAPDLVDLLLRDLIVRDVLQALDRLHVPGAGEELRDLGAELVSGLINGEVPLLDMGIDNRGLERREVEMQRQEDSHHFRCSLPEADAVVGVLVEVP